MLTGKPMFDVVGIGFGPSNIALAIAFEELGIPLKALFLESRASCVWQPGMLFAGSDIQNHPLRDLVTPRNPRSRYSFTNFLFEQGRLFEHLNLGLLFPLRAEYAQYISWVASHFESSVRYGRKVSSIFLHEASGRAQPFYEIVCANGERYYARAVVVAPGRTPYVPEPLASLPSDKVVHLTEYLPALGRLRASGARPRVAVVGGSQSAVEILLHLSDHLPDAHIVGITRRFGYRLKDTSPFTGEVYFPGFVDLFFRANRQTKERLRSDLHLTNYSAADGDVLNQLYQRLYARRLQGDARLEIWRCADVLAARVDGEDVVLEVSQVERDNLTTSARFDLVVIATGFRDIGCAPHQERCPALLHGLLPHLVLDQDGCIQIGHDYALERRASAAAAPVYLNGLCESSHGMGDAGSFSLLALRSKMIADSLRQALVCSAPIAVAAANESRAERLVLRSALAI